MKYLIYFFSILTILKCQDLILFDNGKRIEGRFIEFSNTNILFEIKSKKEKYIQRYYRIKNIAILGVNDKDIKIFNGQKIDKSQTVEPFVAIEWEKRISEDGYIELRKKNGEEISNISIIGLRDSSFKKINTNSTFIEDIALIKILKKRPTHYFIGKGCISLAGLGFVGISSLDFFWKYGGSNTNYPEILGVLIFMGYGGWQGAKGLLKSVPSKDNRYYGIEYSFTGLNTRYKHELLKYIILNQE